MPGAAKDRSGHHQIRVHAAGGVGGRYKLVLKYLARKGAHRDAVSNDPKYNKTWASAAEITDADKDAFREWVEAKMATGGGCSLKRDQAGSSGSLPSRSSARLDELEARAVRHCPLPPPKAISADDGGVAAFIATFASGIMVKALTKVYP